MRKDVENTLLKPEKDVVDLFKYIDQEIKLMKMVRIRHKVSNCYADFFSQEKPH